MKNEAEDTREFGTLSELIEGIEVAMLTTRARDGGLVSRPLQTLEMDAQGDLYFFTAADSGKVEELLAHPEVNVAYADPSRQRYVSVRGRASIERDRARIDALWTPAAKAFFPEGRDDPDLAVLRVRVESAEYWDSPSTFVGRAIGFARALAGEGPKALGDHGHVGPR
ncbi:pyridoxamine 5'-phosphate oxidase family protein [Coralloluteibacterium thermophilus]|uniref:Pyridoxamine 5'-phosphate oxidase family protein n=1 Tax=Coralloluteibacterium thermophilum TaxID=2707049 RepID=A0ABV9NGN6_9GAMM